MNDVFINNTRIGPGEPCYIIAEVAQAHNGSFEQAKAYVDTAAAIGVDAVKFQTHIASEESTLDEPFRVPIPGEYKTRYDYWRSMEYSESQWHALAVHAREKGVTFLSTPFSVAAVELLARIEMPAWKIGSGELRSMELMQAIRCHGGAVLLSTGMSTYSEVSAMVHQLGEWDVPFALLQCTSLYPTPLESVGLNVMDEYRYRFGAPVGLSDHSGTVYPALAAMSRGANVVEVHIVLDRECVGPDESSSLTPEECDLVVRARDAFHQMDSHPVNKDVMANRLSDMRALFTKSIAPLRPLGQGTVLTEEMLAAKKPGMGIPYERRKEVVGRRLSRAVNPDRLLRWEDLDE
jgi:N,N'-diacetyllegionaminate synthase